MQVWLPVYVPDAPLASYRESARVLSTGHLHGQANEALTVFRQCSGVPIPWTGRGWRNIALTRTWRPYARSLAEYGYAVCLEQEARGWKVPHLDLFEVMRRVVRDTGAPPWLAEVAPRCRAQLLAKDPAHYGQFGWGEEPVTMRIWDDLEVAPDGESACSRDRGHRGRHMSTGGWPKPGVVVAWPGTHAPVRADLEEAP